MKQEINIIENVIHSALGLFSNKYFETKNKQEEFKEKIKKQWEESINLPRKKKKRLRKRLLLDWNIANYDIFENLSF